MKNLNQTIALGVDLLTKTPGVVEFALIGSAAYLPEGQVNDVDFAVMLAPGIDAYQFSSETMAALGWRACGDYDTTAGAWFAVRKGDINLMITHDRGFFDRYKTAMEVCKALKLTQKLDRIAVCQIVRDGRLASQVITHQPGLPA